MAYADYAYYIDTFRGNQLSEQEFASFAERAADWIDYLTDGKADGNGPYSEKIKKACCAIAEVVIVSASNDGYSESYANPNSQQTAEQRVLNVARRYLSGTGLLYRGVGRC